MDFLRDLFTSGTFWAAVGAVAALAALIPIAIAGIRKLRQRSLAEFLNQERAFYRESAAKRDREVAKRYKKLAEHDRSEDVDLDRATRYLRAVSDGVRGLEALPHAELEKAKENIRELIAQLRATHQTLVEALELFGTEDTERFFKDFDSFKTRFLSLYNGGQIPSKARTHSSKVRDLVWSLNSQIDSSIIGSDKVRELGNSVVTMDYEIIVPVMISVLERANVELDLISTAIRTGDKRKAIWIKERYWFDVQPLYDEVRETLGRMDAVVSKL